MKEHNITVAGIESEVSRFQLIGLIDEINDKNIIDKYNIKLSKEKTIKMKPEEILELYFYSKSVDIETKFLSEASNQKVDVYMQDGVILISYNLAD